MLKELKVYILVLIFISLAGCASKSFVEGGYDMLAISNETVHELMEYLGEQYQDGKLSENKKEKITSIYNKYRAASDSADTALSIYAETQHEADKEAYLDALSSLLQYRQVFITTAKELLNQ